MPEDAQLLLAAAELAREQAYAPYSHFFVGAAVMSGRGKMYAGCNVENASYGLSVCAERTAVFAAVAAGERAIHGLAVVTDAREPSMPCGACRQVLQEFAASPDIPITLASTEGGVVRLTLAELFPHPFSLP
ncbi:MAG TPA: cytidine deaminase [Chloroflexota bacterium]